MAIKLVLKRQDPKSKQYFLSEKKYLLKTLDRKIILGIFHFGSTAIPAISGKGFVDTYLILRRKKDIPKVLNRILSLTDYAKPKIGGTAERIFLWRKRKIGRKNVTFHLHVSWKSAKEWKDAVIFTEYCLKHPEVAKEYEGLKYEWAEQTRWIRPKYKRKKTEWIKSIIKKAKSEKSWKS